MEKKEFYKIYLPALKKALDDDDKNYGYYVKGPEDYISSDEQNMIEEYLEENEDSFTENVAYYFDAKSHGFPSIKNISIVEYKGLIIDKMNKLKEEFKL